MLVHLGDQDFDTSAEEDRFEKENIQISRADYNDISEVFLFVDENFPAWHTEITNTYNSLPVSLHIARLNGDVKAFAAHNANNFGTGWFGPMGCHPDLQDAGVDAILLKRCMQDMKEWELATSTIPWVNETDFYAKHLQARTERKFLRYEKQIIK